MFQRIHLDHMEDYFRSWSERPKESVYFVRVSAYNEEIQKYIQKYLEHTMHIGACVETKIGNPEGTQLSYYEEIMGLEYQLDKVFFLQKLEKWMPRMDADKKNIIAESFCEVFNNMAQKGKNENMQKNAYIKYMCWLYYKFERVFVKIKGDTSVPKVLYQGYPNEYELNFLHVLSKAGCDILLLLTEGEEGYRKVDTNSVYSETLLIEGTKFPDKFSILNQRQEMMKKQQEPKRPEITTEKLIQTNTWIQGTVYEDIEMPLQNRGSDRHSFYNVFAGIYGVEDTKNYYAKLLQWKMKLEKDTTVYLVEEIQKAGYDEVKEIVRENYESTTALIHHMVSQVVCVDKKIEAYAKVSFCRVLEQETEKPLSKLTNYTVELVCIVKRYLSLIYGNSEKEKKLLLYYGDIKREVERMFLEIMAGLPLDVVIMNPEGKSERNIKSPLFFEKNFENTMKREGFPNDIRGVQFETVAYQAEQELNQVLYQDSGLYRNQQFVKAVPIILSNTYEEIEILWDEEAKYRPNFQILEDKVIVPVIFAKVSGVPRGNVTEYWQNIAKLCLEDVFIINEFPYIANHSNRWINNAYQFLAGGKLLKDKVKKHKDYPFGFIRDGMQDYMLDKMQELIDSKVIEGTGIDGTENLIVATLLNMSKEIIRQIQKYDFTKEIPKVLVLHTRESRALKEDAILLAYLSFVGFDVAIYTPTGYNGVEKYYTRPLVTEHQVGEYKYDLRVPNLKHMKRSSESLMGRLFRRGR